MRIPELPLHNTNLDGNEKAVAYLQLCSFTFRALHTLYLGPLLAHGSSW